MGSGSAMPLGHAIGACWTDVSIGCETGAGMFVSAHLYVRCMLGGCLLGSDCDRRGVVVVEAGCSCQWQWGLVSKGSMGCEGARGVGGVAEGSGQDIAVCSLFSWCWWKTAGKAGYVMARGAWAA